MRWQFLNLKLGEIKVAGTPSIYRRAVLEKINFSNKDFVSCDDTYLSDKLIKAGFKIGLLPILVYDKNGYNFKSTWSRFRWYGEGDYAYFNIMQKNWNLKRKIKSLLHPFNQTIIFSILCIKGKNICMFYGLFIYFFEFGDVLESITSISGNSNFLFFFEILFK